MSDPARVSKKPENHEHTPSTFVTNMAVIVVYHRPLPTYPRNPASTLSSRDPSTTTRIAFCRALIAADEFVHLVVAQPRYCPFRH